MSVFSLLLLFYGCSSYKQFHHITEELEIPAKIFRANYHQGWQAAIEAMKKYDLEVQNQESGVIKTRWQDNTLQVNFANSFSSAEEVKAAKFKVIVNVAKGYRSGKEVSKITVFKRQMIEVGFLQGWKIVPTDGVLEKQILYRIGRLLLIESKLQEIENARNKEAEELLKSQEADEDTSKENDKKN